MRFRILFFCLLPLAPIPGAVAASDAPAAQAIYLKDIDHLLAERNRSLIATRRATAAGEAGIDIASGRPNPVVSLNTSGFNSRRMSAGGNLDTVLRIDQPIERGGKRDLRLAVADSLLQADRSNEAEMLRQQRLMAIQAYFDLKAAEDKSRFADESVLMARKVMTKAEFRLKAGDLSPSDVARIRTDALKAESDAHQAAVDLRRSRLLLAQLLALESDAPRLASADPWPQLASLPTDQPAIEQRPDVVAARLRLEAAERAIGLAKSQQVRDVTVGAQLERAPDERNNTTLGFGVSIPLFTGYDYRGEIRRAHVDRDAANDELARLRAMAAAEFEQARFEAERLSQRARQLRDEALPSARKASDGVQFAFSQGAASVLDVIDARRSLYAIETDTANALADAAKSRAAWAAALNRPDLP